MITITIDRESPENALLRIIKTKLGDEIPVTMTGSIAEGTLVVEIDHEPLTPAQTTQVENAIEKLLRMRGIKALVDVE